MTKSATCCKSDSFRRAAACQGPTRCEPVALRTAAESRKDLTELARDGSAAHRLARRANALVLLDDGMSCEAIAKVLLLDDDTIRTW